MNKAKLVIVGPLKSGKSTIANALSEAREARGDAEYQPTVGVRLLEFGVTDVRVSERTINTDIELWDCSGDHKYESCWPVMTHETGGVIFVCNAEYEKEHNKELQIWYQYYVEKQGLRDNQCIVMMHNKSGQAAGRKPYLSGPMSKLNAVETSLEDDGGRLREEFKLYLSTLFTSLNERREQEEMSFINSR